MFDDLQGGVGAKRQQKGTLEPAIGFLQLDFVSLRLSMENREMNKVTS